MRRPKVPKGLTHLGDAVVVTVATVLASIVLVVSAVFDVMRLIARPLKP